QSRPESHTPNATPAQKDTHHHSRPDQALLVLHQATFALRLAALSHGLPLAAAARLGCMMASTALSTPGAQTYRIDREQLLMTGTRGYAAAAADELAPALDGTS
ncbi:hypothetical protein ACFY0A_43735, partial [Streptomyces sp. NPDC001698]